MSEMSRRQFLKIGGLVLIATGVGGTALYEWLHRTGGAAAAAAGATAMGSTNNHVLVVVQLSGGNDGLNTVIPYTTGLYYDARPNIRIKQSDVLKLTDQYGLHPNMEGLQKLYQQGQVAIVNGVGYPNPILSHFRSMAVWHTGDPTAQSTTGWLGRYLDQTGNSGSDPLRAISLERTVPLALTAKNSDVPSITKPTGYHLLGERAKWWNSDLAAAARGMYSGNDLSALSYVRQQGQQLYRAMDEIKGYTPKLKSTSGYPSTSLASQLQVVAELMGAGVPTRIFYTELGGFDDHAGEERHHGDTLGDFSASVSAFLDDLKQRGLGDQATVLAFSEFGRRVKENGSMGTDHGEAGPVFLIGQRVKGGMYGEYPTLQRLHDGDLAYTVDFRSVYATALEGVLGVPSKDILGGSHEVLHCF